MTTREDIEKKFIEFLKEHKKLTAFKRYCSNPKYTDTPGKFEWILFSRRHQPSSFINSSFNWSETPEDIMFWADLDNKWRKHYSSLTNT